MSPELSTQSQEMPSFGVEEVLIAGNRGPCAGVNMALDATDQVLSIVDGREPVYTNWPVVNNRRIASELSGRGLNVFNNDWSKVPDGSIVMFSAHGVTPEHHRIAGEKGSLTVDTTCQLVTKVHSMAHEAEAQGLHVVYIGKEGHPETVGVMSEVDEANVDLIDAEYAARDINKLNIGTGEDCIVYSQTTLMPDEVVDIEKTLARRFTDIEIPDRNGICYATFSRQKAVEKLVESGIGLLLVVGSPESHNSQMLRRKGERLKIPSYSIDYPHELMPEWFTGVRKVGVTSGASVLDRFMDEVAVWIEARSPSASRSYQEQVKREPMDARYPLPEESLESLRQRFSK
ncbi:MAG: 4-hydroxy-3-methylbut-2-enyl diphosphate reductase [Candidatus Curtissbacteria bacterium]|nr:4-hydroxy-3-methylbut-2-enyl diphosphate reductase [Candidatus Curtissbacteria bacterium]